MKTRYPKSQTHDTIRWANDDDGVLTLSPYHIIRIRRTNFQSVWYIRTVNKNEYIETSHHS
jgi:hypothetical protein